jgi:Tfp pilus assembly protein PilN
MSRGAGPAPDLAIEYSGRGLTVYDPRTRATHPFSDLGTVGAAYGGRFVVVALSRRSVFVRTVRVPNAAPEDIRQVLMVRAAELFPIGPAELAIDFHVTEDLNEEGRLAVVAAVPTVELRRIRDEAKAAGLRVLGVAPVAVGSIGIAQALQQQNAAIVSRDQEGIGIDIVLNGELRLSRVVPANSAIEAEVCRTYSVAGVPCGDIVAAGGVVLKDPDADTNDSPLAALIDSFPAGLRLNLELPEEVEGRLNRKRAQHRRTAFVLAAGAMVTLLYVANDRMEAAAAVDVQVRRAQGPVDTAKRTLKSLGTDITKSQKDVETIERAFQPAQRLGDVAVLMSNRTPDGVWLNGFTAERGKPATVRGTAKTGDAVGRYLQALTSESRLRDVKLVAFANSAKIDETPVVQFSISAFPVGNLTLADPDAKKSTVTKR